MRRKTVLLMMIVGGVFICTLAAEAGDAHKLRYKMKSGTTLKYEISSTSEVIQEIMGSEQTMESESNSELRLTSSGTDEAGNLILTMVYDALQIKVFAAGFDSVLNDPAGIVGKRVKKIVTPEGDQIQSMEIDTFKVPQQVAPNFASDREILPNLPTGELKMNEPVSLSDVDSSDAFGGKIISKSISDYTLVGHESRSGYDCVKIDFTGTVTIEGNGKNFGMDFFIEGDGDLQGTLYFAPKEGLLVDSQNSVEMEMTVAVTGQQNMTIPITQSSQSTIKLLK